MLEEKKENSLYYEILFTVLAAVAVTISLLDIIGKLDLSTNRILYVIDNIILIIFIVDYFLRFILSTNKKYFVSHNIPDLIAIIPFSSLFKVFRIVKLLRFFKLMKLMKLSKLARVFALLTKLNKSASKFLKTNGLIYMLIFAIIVMLLGALSIYVSEKGITVNTFSDAIWWSFVTATTVGYGDISPATTIGRCVAAILMLVGIGTIGMLTGTVATFFIKDKETSNITAKNDINKLLDLSALTDDEFILVSNFAEYLKNK